MAGPQDAQINALVQSAQQLMRAGRLDDAARTWEQVRALAPNHSQALFFLGQHVLVSGRNALAAIDLFQRAASADPQSPVIPLNLAFAYRTLGDAQNEMAALMRALAIDPYFYPALLAKGMLEERLGQRRLAAQTYKNVLTIAPPDDQLTEEIRKAIAHAREIVGTNAAELEKYLNAQLDAIRARHAGEALDRFEECKDVVTGAKKVYTQQPSLLHFPRLPAIQFYNRAEFPWLKQLEAAADDMRAELRVILDEDRKDFKPYVAHPEGSPLNQWAELNYSPRWSTYFLWKDGVRNAEACARCPRTAAASEAVPVIDIPNFGPTIMFSVLAPHTHIPPHSSVTNARLVVHLPLIVPEGCRFRVGNETREWREGEAWVFDDTIDHEAWNDSDQYRVILMIDIWNPYLTSAERELVGALLNGVRDYYKV